MCGIVGIYDHTNTGRADPSLVSAMAQAVAHRGPDGEGFFSWPHDSPQVSLGVRRLGIIDLATGHQPIFNEDHTLALVFNGEIYNYIELRAGLAQRGHAFSTQGDAEVLVHLYEEHGLDLFQYLRGMYAFALWDGRVAQLVLAADHVGVKPLYIAERDGRLLFASEVKALLVDPGLPRRVNTAALDTYLNFGYMIGPDTLYEGIRRLMPGHALVVAGSQSRLVRYWAFDYPPASERPTDSRLIAAETRERLTEAVRLQLRSDVPLGLFLSGGIDSAALLALMTRITAAPARTFAVGYSTSSGTRTADDETAQASRVAGHFGAIHNELTLSADEWWDTLLAYSYVHDEPNANPSAVSLLALSRLTADYVKVVLCGVGGDELFCGYPSHNNYPVRMRMAARLNRWLPGPFRAWLSDVVLPSAEAAYRALRRRRYLGALVARLIDYRMLVLSLPDGLLRAMSYDGIVSSGEERASLYSADLRVLCEQSRHKERAFREILSKAWADDPGDLVQALVMHTWLPGDGLLSLDKVTMAHSLEARVPFFDQELLAFACRIPSAVRLKRNKYVLREAMRADLPDFVLQRPKRAFGTPILSWFDHELSSRIRAVLLDPQSLGRGWFRPEALERLVTDHFQGQVDRTELLFRLLLLELWQQAGIDAPPHVPDPFHRPVRSESIA